MLTINDYDTGSDYEEIKFFIILDRESGETLGNFKHYEDAFKKCKELQSQGRDCFVSGEY